MLPTESANLTNPALSNGDDLEGKYRVDIRVGLSMQHVGTLRKHRLYQRIFDCLTDIGAPAEKIPDSKTDNELCKWPGTQNGCVKECTIPNIVYNADLKNNKYATNAWLAVWVAWSEIRENAHPGLRKVAVGKVPKTFVQQTGSHIHSTKRSQISTR
jgi:hypothetical protein